MAQRWQPGSPSSLDGAAQPSSGPSGAEQPTFTQSPNDTSQRWEPGSPSGFDGDAQPSSRRSGAEQPTFSMSGGFHIQWFHWFHWEGPNGPEESHWGHPFPEKMRRDALPTRLALIVTGQGERLVNFRGHYGARRWSDWHGSWNVDPLTNMHVMEFRYTPHGRQTVRHELEPLESGEQDVFWQRFYRRGPPQRMMVLSSFMLHLDLEALQQAQNRFPPPPTALLGPPHDDEVLDQ